MRNVIYHLQPYPELQSQWGPPWEDHLITPCGHEADRARRSPSITELNCLTVFITISSCFSPFCNVETADRTQPRTLSQAHNSKWKFILILSRWHEFHKRWRMLFGSHRMEGLHEESRTNKPLSTSWVQWLEISRLNYNNPRPNATTVLTFMIKLKLETQWEHVPRTAACTPRLSTPQ